MTVTPARRNDIKLGCLSEACFLTANEERSIEMKIASTLALCGLVLIQPHVLANEALGFIESKAHRVKLPSPGASRMWSVYELRTVGSVLKWREVDSRFPYSAEEPIVQRDEEYSVDARDITLPVAVNGTTVSFECRSSKCFTAKISTSVEVAQPGKKPPDVNTIEQRSTNTWYFKSADDAKRAAVALSDALAALGATNRKY
jgi:hypothetical protein